MRKTLPNSPVSSVAILAAALELQRIHGTKLATRFLEPYGVDEQVVNELLEPWGNGDNR